MGFISEETTVDIDVSSIQASAGEVTEDDGKPYLTETVTAKVVWKNKLSVGLSSEGKGGSAGTSIPAPDNVVGEADVRIFAKKCKVATTQPGGAPATRSQ
ncbi:MAG: hypothetical protein ACTHN5_13175 [Phycisphaerae bacterium]